MANVQLDGVAIRDWLSFHRECQTKFGFPEFYGRNMDAWIDCLSTLRNDDGMSAFTLAPDETLQIEITNSSVLRNQAAQIFDALPDCVDAVNERYIENGEKPAVELVFR
jgi:RNAse (barnase) inhibitor barstar